jgi:hypothetical protein
MPGEHIEEEINPFRQRQEQRYMAAHKCVFCAQLLKLPPTKLKQTYDALNNRKIGNLAILDVLTEWKIKTSETAISMHRGWYTKRARCLQILREKVG